MGIPEAFADIALAFSQAGLGAFYDSKAKWPGTPTYDTGGSIAAPGTPIEADCSVQVDAVTEAMRLEVGYRDKDVRLIILRAGVELNLDTDATVEILNGPNTGNWSIQSVGGDPCAITWECRGRAVNVAAEDS